MSMSDDDKLEQISDENITKSQIEKTLERKSRLDEAIKLETSDIETKSKDLSQEIDNKKTEIKEKTSEINKKITVFSNGARKFVDDSTKLSNNTLDKFGDISRSLLKKLYVVLGIFTASFVISYYHFIGLVYEPTIIVGFITFIAILVTILKTISSFNDSITKARQDNFQVMTKFQENSLPVIKDELKVEPDFDNVKKNQALLFAGLEKIFGAVKEYVPITDEHYSSKERRAGQKYFAQTLKNALEEYHLSNPTTEKYLMERFGPPENSEKEWLSKAAKNIGIFSEIDPIIVKLCYYDYVGDSSGLKDIWKEIKEKKLLDELITRLMMIFGVPVQTSNGKKIFNDITSGLDVFTLNEFSNLYNRFYVDLEKEKKLLLQILVDLGFNLKDEEQNRIKNFLPTTKDFNKWFIELITETSAALSFNFNLLWLLYLDRIGDIGKKSIVWTSIRKDDSILHTLSNTLIENNLIQLDREFNKSDLRNLVYEVIKIEQTFDIIQINKTVSRKIQAVSRTKSLFSFALESKNCAIPEIVKIEYDRMLVADEPVDTSIAKILAEYLEIPCDFVLLFYYDYTQNVPQRKSIFTTIKNTRSYDLMKFLIQKNLILAYDKENDNFEGRILEKILTVFDDFDLEHLRKLYIFYKVLMNESKNLISFLTDEEIQCQQTVSLENLIEIYGKTFELSKYKTIEKLATYLVKNEQNRILTDEEYYSLISAIMVLFFDRYYDLSKEDACKTAAGHELSIKMLYLWIKSTSREQFAKMKITIGSILQQALSDEKIDIDISEFKTKLEEGVLIGSEKQLWSMRFDRVDRGLEKINQDERYRRILSKFSDSLENLMKTKISNDFIIQALNSQAISAYMITRNSGKVIEVIDEDLEKSCSELSSTDNRFKNLYLIEPKTTTTGYSTRVGLVPLSIENFDEFSDLFSKAFDHAVSKKSEKNISANLIRIFPSDLTFKPLHPGGSKHDPVEAIRNLMVDKLGAIEKIKIAASAQKSQTPEIALRDVIFNVINSRTKIYTIIEDHIINIVNAHPEFLKFLESQEYDNQIEKHYSTSGLAELANKLHSKYKVNPVETTRMFTEFIETTLKSNRINLNQTEIQQLSNATLENLSDIGFILNSNSVIV